MVWYGMIWCGGDQAGMMWYSMVWYGMVRYGVVWGDRQVWYGMVGMVGGDQAGVAVCNCGKESDTRRSSRPTHIRGKHHKTLHTNL